MQRLNNIDKWSLLADGKSLNFEARHARRVRLDVNAPAKVGLYYASTNGEVTFLGLIEGRDVIEFFAVGEFSVTASGGDVWFHTVDGEKMSVENPDAVIFTKIIGRRARNHELELMNYMMNQNLERRLAAQRAELERLWSGRERAAAAAAGQPAVAGDAAGAAGEPEPAGGDAPAGSVQEVDGGGAPSAKSAKA